MSLAKYNNPVGYINAALLLLNLGASVGYLVQGDYRRSAYFFFSFCIIATVVL